MPKLNRAPADRGRPFDPAPLAPGNWGGFHAQDPRIGDQGYDPYPAMWASYGPPRGPADIQTRTQFAGMAHLIKAVNQTREGRYSELYQAYYFKILTPTSFVYSTVALKAEESDWYKGLQLPKADWTNE
jgi:hypothetical protein